MKRPSTPVGKSKGVASGKPNLGLGAGRKGALPTGIPMPTGAPAAPPPPANLSGGPGAASASDTGAGSMAPMGFRKGGKVKAVMKKGRR